MVDGISTKKKDISSKTKGIHTRLERLKVDEQVIIDDLEQLATQRQRFMVLSEVSDGLEKLERLGGSDLFWGENHNHAAVAKDQERISHLIDKYDSRVAKLLARQGTNHDVFKSLTASINILNEEAVSLQQHEEHTVQDFIVERELVVLPFRAMQMPWNRQDADQKQFRRVLLIVLFFSISLGILIPRWYIPIPDRVIVAEIPERVVQLMLLREKIAPPPPPPKKEEKPIAKEADKPVSDKPIKAPEKVPKTVARSGLMAFKDEFADLIDDTPVAKLGAQATISGKGSKARPGPRSLVTARIGAASGGINSAALSRNLGGIGERIGGVEFSRAETTIGSDFFGEERPLSKGLGPSRTDEEIQIVFDRFKAALYRIYNRELRKNPTLQGRMVLRITIEPDGSVSLSIVDSIEIDSDTLGDKIAARVKKFNFGAKEGVPALTILYPIDFLPAT